MAADASRERTGGERTGGAVLEDALQPPAVIPGLVLNRVADNSAARDEVQSTLESREFARRVYSITEDDDRFSTLDLIHLLNDGQIDGIVEAGQITGFDRPDGMLEFRRVVGEIADEAHALIEGHDHDAIVWLELFDESERGFTNRRELVLCAATGVDQ